MAVVKNEKKVANEEIARQIREVGESLIKNAESIAGSEKYLNSIYISCEIGYEGGTVKAPEISVDRRFCPEQFVERMMNGE